MLSFQLLEFKMSGGWKGVLEKRTWLPSHQKNKFITALTSRDATAGTIADDKC